MTQTAIQTDAYADAFDRLRNSRRGEPDWLASIRAAAFEYFQDVGFPGPKDEAWRFTNLKPIRETVFTLPEVKPTRISTIELERFGFDGLSTHQAVFVDGRFVRELSDLSRLPAGVRVVPLAQALADGMERFEAVLLDDATAFNDAFAALNIAFMTDGVCIHVPRGIVLDEPIHLLSITLGAEQPTMMHTRNIIFIDEAAQASVIEQYVAPGSAPGSNESAYLNNAVTQLFAADGAVAHHYFIEREGAEAYNIATLKTHQQRDTDVRSHTALLGGALVRNNVHTVLAGEGGHCLINGLFVGHDRQHLDNHMRVEHAAPRCDSRQFYRGILDDQAGGVFTGRIYVHRVAQKTDAKQTSQNLLLSNRATMNAQPQLEIHADDVKCTHGATTGQLDEQALLYLRSRGIDAGMARAMLIYAFAGETLERIHLEPVRRSLARLLLDRLPHGLSIDPRI